MIEATATEASTRPTAYTNPGARTWRCEAAADGARRFHTRIEGYSPTPLLPVPQLAADNGLGAFFVKDESSRLELPAFKILGASYAISRAISTQLGRPGQALALDELRDALSARDPIELVCATDGNHGRAVARVARKIGAPARVFFPAGISQSAKDAIATEGALAVEIDAEYDDVVETALNWAERERSILIQDTALPGYMEVPSWIVDGYATLFEEADDQLRALGLDDVDVVIVPAGVGSLLQAAVRHYRARDSRTAVVCVEPENAPAIITSLLAGERVSVATAHTVMAGMNCGTPSLIAWPYLRQGVSAAVSVSDAETVEAVSRLSEVGVDAGPCGAAGLAATRRVLTDATLRDSLGLDDKSSVLIINTESLTANPV